jgi:hypothetical protein
LLNRAARFFPILKELKSHLPAGGAVLEVGSGSMGLGEFWSEPFVGCDLMFSSRPVANMRAVQCSAYQLPFRDRAFDAVLVSDVMEHIPPTLRTQVFTEALRVARKIVVFGYPCGRAAHEVDKKLYRDYQSRKLAPPIWLEEHMLHPFPDESLLTDLPTGWKKQVIPNETLRFHYWMMKTEMSPLWNFCLRLLLKMAPGLVGRCLKHANREPSYRKIFVLTCEANDAHP